MSGDADLYERDFVAWTEAQAAELRAAAAARTNLPIDWENLAEEIEGLGMEDGRELQSRLTTVVAHLWKLRWSSASDLAAGWRHTVTRSRQEIDDILDENRSLRRRLPQMLEKAHDRAYRLVSDDLAARGELKDPENALPAGGGDRFGLDDVPGGWWPEGRG
jgi:Domain of unknown function DUF29